MSRSGSRSSSNSSIDRSPWSSESIIHFAGNVSGDDTADAREIVIMPGLLRLRHGSCNRNPLRHQTNAKFESKTNDVTRTDGPFSEVTRPLQLRFNSRIRLIFATFTLQATQRSTRFQPCCRAREYPEIPWT